MKVSSSTRKIYGGIQQFPALIPKIKESRVEIKELLGRLYTFILFNYYEFKFWAEYNIPNIIDPLPKQKRNEDFDIYVRRLPIQQALRHSKYQYYYWAKFDSRAQSIDLSQFKGKRRSSLKKLITSVNKISLSWDEIFRETNQRYFDEKMEEQRNKH